MKKIFLAILLLKTSLYASAMTPEELNYLKDYPKASKATVILDYLFIEDSQGNILEQCFLPKKGSKICSPISKSEANTVPGANNSNSDSIPLSKPIK